MLEVYHAAVRKAISYQSMLDKLKYESWPEQPKYYVNGDAILKLADEVMQEFGVMSGTLKKVSSKGAPDGFVLGAKPIDWFEVAKVLDKNYRSTLCWFGICGRYVWKSQHGFYMCDGGGIGQDVVRAWDQPYIRDPSNPSKSLVSGQRFTRGGPSYGEFAARFIDQQTHSRKWSGDNEAWSKAKAIKLRSVLMGDSILAGKLAQKGDLDSGQFLPVLAATLFLAEPARNRLAFLTALMLLDMVELGIHYGSGKAYTWDKLMKRPRKDHLHGGKLPAANTGSAGAGASASKGTTARTEPGLLTGLKATQNKELTIICRYLEGASFTPLKTGDIIPKDYNEITAKTGVVIRKKCPEGPDWPTQILGYLKYLISLRLGSFDYK